MNPIFHLYFSKGIGQDNNKTKPQTMKDWRQIYRIKLSLPVQMLGSASLKRAPLSALIEPLTSYRRLE